MAVTASPYGAFLTGLGTAAFNFNTDQLRVILCDNSYAADMDAHVFYSDITGELNPASATGYTTGGKILSSQAWAYDAAMDRTVLTAAPLTWSAATFTARTAVAMKYTGTPSNSRLIGWIDFGEDKTYSNEDFQLIFSAGVVRIKAA